MNKDSKKKKRISRKDPFAKREAKKYDNPIASREYLIEILAKKGKPMSYEALAKAIKIKDDEAAIALQRRLKAMCRDGQIIRLRKGVFGLINKMDLIKGQVIGHRDGYGFISPLNGGEDLYLNYHEMRRVFHGDLVLVREVERRRGGKREARIVEVLESNTQQCVGRLLAESGITFVVPDRKEFTHEILIPPEGRHDARDGQIVLIEITKQPGPYTQPIGEVVEVLGDALDPGMEIELALRSFELPHQWPDEVQLAVQGLSPEVAENDKVKRKDIRKLPLVTIDGEDAKDFDDAVYCESSKSDGWRLIVAIADVSHYVQPDSALDKEAIERGNSVYFPGRVIPMLPEVLSNGLCSLNPNVDRLCMVADMRIAGDGKLTRFRFYPAVMHSHARLTYEQVSAWLQEPSSVPKAYQKRLPQLQNLQSVYQALRSRREKRGAIDLDLPETQIIFGPEKKIKKIVPRTRSESHMIIEECMLAANISAARFLKQHKMPILYRNHETPALEKITDLKAFLAELSLSLAGGKEPRAKHYMAVLKQARSRPDFQIIQTVMLRSLSQARYSPEILGHFALAYSAYTHFTSPIRRYPDLLVHRAIRHVLSKRQPELFTYNLGEMADYGEHCSMTERRADEATREVTNWLKCEYMQDQVGKKFAGVISSVTNFGLFVELKDIYVEGLVHISELANDYYHYDAVHHRLHGERNGKIFRLGDSIEVYVTRVDLDARKIDFGLV